MKLEAVDPSELTFSFDINSKSKNFVFPAVLYDGQKLAISFEGILVTDGLCTYKFDNKDTFSLGVSVDKDVMIRLEAISNVLFENFQDWQIKSISPDGDVLFLNLKYKKNVFSVESNVIITPKNFATAKLQRDQKVKIIADVFAYFQKENKKAGLTIQPKKLIFAEIENVKIPDE